MSDPRPDRVAARPQYRWFSRPLWVHCVAAPLFVAIVTLPLWGSRVF